MRTRLVIGVALCFIGAVWIGQGIGTIEGSFMTGETIWAVIGAISIAVGAAIIVGTRQQQRLRRRDRAMGKDGNAPGPVTE